MKYVIIAKNVLNIEEVIEEIKNLTEDKAVKDWIEKKFKKYFLNEESEGLKFKEVRKVPSSYLSEKWVKIGVEKGEEFYTLSLNSSFERTVREHLIPFLEYLSKYNPSKLKGLGHKKVFEELRKWEEELDKNPKKTFGYEELFTLKGFKWYVITEKKTQFADGQMNSNCLKKELYGDDYWDDYEAGRSLILGVRDKTGWCVISIEYNIKQKKIKQFLGKSNKPIKEEHGKVGGKGLSLLIDKGIKFRGKTYKIEGFYEYCFEEYEEMFTSKGYINSTDVLKPGDKIFKAFLKDDSLLKENSGIKIYGKIKFDESFEEITITKFEGNLDLEGSNIKTLPESLEVKGNINLMNTKNLKYLPKNVKCDVLFLNRSNIKKIDSGLQCNYLDLNRSKIKHLPEGLEVKGYINLNTIKNLKYLPKNVKCDKLNLFNSSIEKIDSGLQCNSLDLDGSKIKYLPEGLEVKGKIDLSYTKNLKYLPKNIKCNDLFLKGSSIKTLPKDLIVKEKLVLSKELEGKIKIPKGVNEVTYK